MRHFAEDAAAKSCHAAEKQPATPACAEETRSEVIIRGAASLSVLMVPHNAPFLSEMLHVSLPARFWEAVAPMRQDAVYSCIAQQQKQRSFQHDRAADAQSIDIWFGNVRV